KGVVSSQLSESRSEDRAESHGASCLAVYRREHPRPGEPGRRPQSIPRITAGGRQATPARRGKKTRGLPTSVRRSASNRIADQFAGHYQRTNAAPNGERVKQSGARAASAGGAAVE